MTSPAYKVGVLTTGRADFSIYHPVIKAMQAHPALEPGLFVTGMHLSEDFGLTVENVRASGFPILSEFSCLDPRDTPIGVSTSMGLAMQGMAKALDETPCDILMVLGDRFEMCAAALAAVPFRLQLVHIHGGDETEGAIDNVFRHTLTKISHLHCCATQLAAQRIGQMGEDPNNIHIVGAPALDHIQAVKRLSRAELATRFGLHKTAPYVLLTYHSVTMDPEATHREFAGICAALDTLDMHAVFTAANADTTGRALNDKIRAYVAQNANAIMVDHMGAQGYYSAMEHGHLMLGNSSSGILEAASFALPVVNVGERQSGRERSPNTIDVDGFGNSILEGVEKAMTSQFQNICDRRENVYGDGKAGPRIAECVAAFLGKNEDARKSFNLLESPQ